MNLDELRNVWQERQSEVDHEALDRIATKVRRKSTTLGRKILIRDVIECIAALSVIPTFWWYLTAFDALLVKLGALVVLAGIAQIIVVLFSTRFRKPVAPDKSFSAYLSDQLDRVQRQRWLLNHVTYWYAGPIMVGCLLIFWGRDPWWIALIETIVAAIFSGLIIWINRWSANRKLLPLENEFLESLRSLSDDVEIDEPYFPRYEKMKSINIKLMILVLTVAALWSGLKHLPAGELDPDEAQTFAQALVDGNRVKGLSIGLIKGDRKFTIHAGDSGRSYGTPNDTSLYEIGSITKVFTGLLLADAATKEPGLLDQPARVSTIQRLPDNDGVKITWKHLATHRSGLPRLADNMPDLEGKDPYATYTSTLAADFLASLSRVRDPGKRYEYSNFGVSWLGYLVAAKSGKPYEQLLREVITGPLGMSDTSITLTADQKARFAMPHTADGNRSNPWNFADLPGAGGIRSSITDMMKFAEANLDPPEGDLGRSIELAWKKHAEPDTQGFAMGLGWHFARDGQTRWHNGQTGGHCAAVFINRKLDAAVVILSNTGNSTDVDRLAESLIQRLAGAAIKPPKFAKAVGVTPDKMKRLEGRYQLAPNFIFDVNVVDGNLMVGVTNQPTHQVYAKNDTTWFYKVVEAELEFELAATGPAKSVTLYQNGIRQKARRIRN